MIPAIPIVVFVGDFDFAFIFFSAIDVPECVVGMFLDFFRFGVGICHIVIVHQNEDRFAASGDKIRALVDRDELWVLELGGNVYLLPLPREA
jgi:hypothetical protein